MPNNLGRPTLKLGDIVQGHTYMGGDPNSQQSWVNADDMVSSGKTGEEFLATLQKNHPTLANMVKALAEGRQEVPKNRLGVDPFYKTAFQLAQQYDPSLDEASYPMRVKTAVDFGASGVAAQNIRNLNQAIGHLHDMTKASTGVTGMGGGLVSGLFGLAHPLNWVANSVEGAAGDPRITAYEAPRTALASELASVFKGKGTSNEAEVKKLYDLLSINNSTPQKMQAAKSLSSLMKSRLDELADQYNQGMGTTKQGLHFLNSSASKQFGELQQAGDEETPGSPAVDDKTSSLLKRYKVPGY